MCMCVCTAPCACMALRSTATRPTVVFLVFSEHGFCGQTCNVTWPCVVWRGKEGLGHASGDAFGSEPPSASAVAPRCCLFGCDGFPTPPADHFSVKIRPIDFVVILLFCHPPASDCVKVQFVWAKAGCGIWGLGHVLEDRLYLSKDVVDDIFAPTHSKTCSQGRPTACPRGQARPLVCIPFARVSCKRPQSPCSRSALRPCFAPATIGAAAVSVAAVVAAMGRWLMGLDTF